MLLQACLNGSRMPGEHSALPLTPEDLARDAQRVVSAGAQALHIHPRNAEGLQSLAHEDIAAALMAIRQCCPGLSCGVSTARWIEPDVSAFSSNRMRPMWRRRWVMGLVSPRGLHRRQSYSIRPSRFYRYQRRAGRYCLRSHGRRQQVRHHLRFTARPA
jgi:hypothetical protein